MPAFTCPVVKTAVGLAGKQIHYVDIARHSLNVTSEQFAEKARAGRILLPTHLFGIPTDIERICELARERDCITIEDAAAAFGAKHNERALGTFADFGVFSFERSKRLPAFRGAAIVVNNENLIDPARLASHRVVRTEYEAPVREAFMAAIYNLATRPFLYGRVTLPRLLHGYRNDAVVEHCQKAGDGPLTSFYTREFHRYQAALVVRSLRRLSAIRAHVEAIVGIYQDILRSAPVETFLTSGTDLGGLLRFPLYFQGQERSNVLRAALRAGLYLETNFEQPLVELDQYGKYPQALRAARDLVLLPLYRRLNLEAARQLAKQVAEIAGQISASDCREQSEESAAAQAELVLHVLPGPTHKTRAIQPQHNGGQSQGGIAL